MIRGMCVVIPAEFTQLVGDGLATIARLESVGADLGDAAQTLADVETLAGLVTDGCYYLNGLFDALIDIFLPGFLCIVAIVFAAYINNQLCCAAGCCKAPPGGKKAGGKDV